MILAAGLATLSLQGCALLSPRQLPPSLPPSTLTLSCPAPVARDPATNRDLARAWVEALAGWKECHERHRRLTEAVLLR